MLISKLNVRSYCSDTDNIIIDLISSTWYNVTVSGFYLRYSCVYSRYVHMYVPNLWLLVHSSSILLII